VNVTFQHDLAPRVMPTLLVLACLFGVGIVYSPTATLMAVLGIALAIALAVSARPLLVAFLLLIVFQDLLRVLTGGDDTTLGFLIRRFDEVLILVLGGLCLISSRTSRTFLQQRIVAVTLIGCYTCFIISSALHPLGWIPTIVDVCLFSKPFLILCIGASIALSDSEILAARNRIIGVMLSVVLFGLVFLVAPNLQDAYIGDVRAPDERLGLLSAQGFFIGPGSYSWFCAATFGVCYAAYLAFQRNAFAVATAIAGLFTILSWRRKSIVAIVAILLIALAVRTRPGSRVRAVALLAIVMLIGFTFFAPYAAGLWADTVREYGGSPHHLAGRTALYVTSVSIARDYFPFGAGFASFGSHASKLYYSPLYERYGLATTWGFAPHSSYFITDTYWPMVLAEGGVLALGFYAVFAGFLFRQVWVLTRAPAKSEAHAFLALSSLFLLTGSFVESTTSHFYGATLHATLGLLPGAVLIGRTLRESTD
jgi:hypothetical protein